jgi:arginine decarboxylase
VPGIPGGNIRKAYFLAYRENTCEYIKLQDCESTMKKGRKIISASFVIPYPPGFPVLVPGQVMTKEILDFLLALDVKEIHGFRPELGLRVFKMEALEEEPQVASSKVSIKMEKPGGNGNGKKPQHSDVKKEANKKEIVNA